MINSLSIKNKNKNNTKQTNLLSRVVSGDLWEETVVVGAVASLKKNKTKKERERDGFFFFLNVKNVGCFYLLIEVQVISSVLFALVVVGVAAVVVVVEVVGFFLVTFGFLREVVVVLRVVEVVVSFCAVVYQNI